MVFPHVYRTEHSETATSNNMYGDYFNVAQSNKIKIQPQLLKIVQNLDSMKGKLVETLEKFIKIKSIASDITYNDEVKKMVKLVGDWLKELDMKFEVFNIGFHHVEGKKIRLPPVILASMGNDPKKKTLCAYAHLDVPDPKYSKWDTDPWILTNKDGSLYGNGAGCGKGPLVCWLYTLLAFKLSKVPLPVNFRFCIELMSHNKSQGFLAFVNTKKQDFFNQIDFVAQVTGEWMGTKIPCIIYGCVGILHMEMTIEGDSTDALKKDMDKIISSMVDAQNQITIPHYSDMVDQIGPDEEMTYTKIQEFDPKKIRASLPAFQRGWDRVRLLMYMWRLPTVFLDDIEECSCPNREKKMIKRNLILKIVPRQTVDFTEAMVRTHITKKIKENNITNKVALKSVNAIRPWVENYTSFNYGAARRAFIQIYKVEPNLIREDIGRETTAIFASALEKNLVILPICAKGSNLGRGNEHISGRCIQEGAKVLAAYMFQLDEKPKKHSK